MGAAPVVRFLQNEALLGFPNSGRTVRTKMRVSSLKLASVSLGSKFGLGKLHLPVPWEVAELTCLARLLPPPPSQTAFPPCPRRLAKWPPGFLVDVGWFLPVGPTSQFSLPA
ncbi:uncharacterized protein LY79DRAFT_380977 [Colletotrichum navitas]|uniref:Uncharacterized protein n=1 Tax=Colletotrichum navitas TaxID=681940 RepID=A0AAD8V8W1_9PEZI|nr:uncharacterized protein LY79DRAFT_380977 [Colletotrichum navitas]KAK1597319.1 hypothetical protein LY79DRAFT_380977 [Colletotrichum navitas]